MFTEESLSLAALEYSKNANCYTSHEIAAEVGFAKGATWARKNQWISSEEHPLITEDENKWWTATENGMQQFIAAVPTNKGWWIKLCCLEDETGLVVIGDDDNEGAGWHVTDVTHYMLIDESTLPIYGVKESS